MNHNTTNGGMQGARKPLWAGKPRAWIPACVTRAFRFAHAPYEYESLRERQRVLNFVRAAGTFPFADVVQGDLIELLAFSPAGSNRSHSPFYDLSNLEADRIA
jgi:hypothetical protein